MCLFYVIKMRKEVKIAVHMLSHERSWVGSYLICILILSFPAIPIGKNSAMQVGILNSRLHNPNGIIKCETGKEPLRSSKLEIGSPIVIVEAPKMIKTAAPMPCLRLNSGLVKPGDVGRIISRKPKDVWAVRLSIGTYLLDGKYFKPLDLDE